MKKLQPFLSILMVLVIVFSVKFVIQQSFKEGIKKDLQQSIAADLAKTSPSASPSPTPSPTAITAPFQRGSIPQTNFGLPIGLPTPIPTPKSLFPNLSFGLPGVTVPVKIVGDCELPNCVRTPKNRVAVNTAVTILEDGGAQNRDTVFNRMSKCSVPYGSLLLLESEWDDNYFQAKVRTMEGTSGSMCPNGISVAVEKKLWWKYTPQFSADETERLNKTTP